MAGILIKKMNRISNGFDPHPPLWAKAVDCMEVPQTSHNNFETIIYNNNNKEREGNGKEEDSRESNGNKRERDDNNRDREGRGRIREKIRVGEEVIEFEEMKILDTKEVAN